MLGILGKYIKFYGSLLLNYLLWGTKDNHVTIKKNVFSKHPIFISTICIKRISVEMKENTGDDSIKGPGSYSD